MYLRQSVHGLKSTKALRQTVPDVNVLETVCTWLEEYYCLKAGCIWYKCTWDSRYLVWRALLPWGRLYLMHMYLRQSVLGLKSTIALRQAVPDVNILEPVFTWIEEHYCLEAGSSWCKCTWDSLYLAWRALLPWGRLYLIYMYLRKSVPGLKSTNAFRQAVPDVNNLVTVCTWAEEH